MPIISPKGTLIPFMDFPLNLETVFLAIKSGLGEIPKQFVNMRKTRSNEVVRDFGEVKESLRIGHSTKVMREHYFRLSDDDFLEATGKLDSQISPCKIDCNGR